MPGSGRDSASAVTASRSVGDSGRQGCTVTTGPARRQVPAISSPTRRAPGQTRGVQSSPRRFSSGTSRARSAAECHQLTRDVQEAVQIMMATLRAPERLDRDRTALWVA